MTVKVGMTVKSVRGRRRYTSFEVPMNVDRHAAESAVRDIPSAKVITCTCGLAVIRSLPEDRDALAESVSSAFPGSRSLDCSGTLRALRTRDPRLIAPRRHKKRRLLLPGRNQTLYTAPSFESR